ncbi:MAG: hypothetical protein JO342_05260 [Solirubrobacterales bacterium]|nr:hypothetical protein [Solirubrobacterales bacterium]
MLNAETINAHNSDESGVLVKGGHVTLRNSRVATTGDSKSSDQSSFYGLGAGVLAESRGKLILSGGSVSTSGNGANAVFASGSGALVNVIGATLKGTGQYAHGAMAAGGGKLKLTNVIISTAGGSSAAVATDRGGGTGTVVGGRMHTSGPTSPGIYSTGNITVTGATMTATGSEAAVVEGANSITVVDTHLTGTVKRGVMLYQSFSGDAQRGTGTYTMRGGTLAAKAGPAFYVTNEKAVINLSGGAKIAARSGVLLRADNAGTGSGNTGAGVATLNASHEDLSGDIVAVGTGSIAAKLNKQHTARHDHQRGADAERQHVDGRRRLRPHQSQRHHDQARHRDEHHRKRAHRDLQRQAQSQPRGKDLQARRRRHTQGRITRPAALRASGQAWPRATGLIGDRSERSSRS